MKLKYFSRREDIESFTTADNFIRHEYNHDESGHIREPKPKRNEVQEGFESPSQIYQNREKWKIYLYK